MKKQIANIKEALAVLDFKKWYYETAKAHETTDIPMNMPLEKLPKEYLDVRKKLRDE
ncbi:MAG: hypothetical protein Q4D35_05490 [Ruminococcus sp.]|nr:hypothetical protein [Ruminococcus sp.]